MKKRYLLLFLTLVCLAGRSAAQVIQPCGTDEMYRKYKQMHPEIAVYEKQIDAEIAQYLAGKSIHASAKTTGAAHADSDWYDIPVVVHVNHNYGAEFLADNSIYNLIAEMNRFYALQSDTATVIQAFKQYVGKAKFRFHLATVDPNGNPTRGITHHLTYLTYGGDDQAKMDLWSPTNYVNIWFDNVIGEAVTNGIVVAYTTPLAAAAVLPYYDGIISNYSFIGDAGTGPGAGGGSIDHEMGHFFNLAHTFGGSNNVGTNTSGNCLDDDGVDDTPPTDGNFGGCPLNDTVCSKNYFKIYPSASGGDSLVNYPDTANVQNIMNYADCKYMFTKGQVARMRATLNSDVAGRNNLWDTTNLITTGVWTSSYTDAAIPDLAPVIDYSVKTGSNINYFTFPGVPLSFAQKCWRDTITAVNWTFSNSASAPTSTAIGNFTNSFADPGWVTIGLTATGNGTGSTTTIDSNRVFVADQNGTDVSNYYQEFDPAGDRAKWPMFNYYNNEFKWQLANTGLYDNYSVEYVGYDARVNPLFGIYPYTGTPKGDFDDMFSVPVNLSSFTDACNLDFYYSAASRSSVSLDLTDTLIIDYSVNKSTTWTNLVKLTKGSLINKGAVSVSYAPVAQTDWSPKTIALPADARTAYTTFRFRYKPGVGQDGVYSSGNNFYMDRISFGRLPAGVNDVKMGAVDVAVAPNPTNGDAYVIVKDADNTTANVVVTDIAGKVVYTTSQAIAGHESRILIPHTAIQVQGIYLVQTITGNQTHTQKLVVY